ncbi:hypothetical protein INT48_000630 [Thamnidium elegans]|uniref:Uncharacterized protein n=1 Tax=Thamnidium elegans TaxID=101142 RepID=A0A8H7VS63_9FUNG|nr:hypothetical protein INT48_000630 [Thamnidium elegans]
MNIKTVPAKNNNNNITLRKSPLTQLKQDLERLRQQKIDDESLIQKQTQEIIALKKKLIGTKELELQLLKKATIETKLTLVNKEIKNLSTDVIDLLQVTNSSDRITNKESIEKLKTQLEIQEDDFKKKLERYTTLTIEINQNIYSHQELLNKLKLDHATQISQLNSNHIDHLNKLKLGHKQELINLKNKKSSCNLNNLDHILEQALLEFEQEQYNHIPTILIQHDSNHKSLHGKIIPAMMNQQWYSKKFIPVDAVSWPAPQPSPNLKKLHNHTR